MSNGDKPVFPAFMGKAEEDTPEAELYYFDKGLTKREWFAGMALIAITDTPVGPEDITLTRDAVKWADALLKALEAKP